MRNKLLVFLLVLLMGISTVACDNTGGDTSRAEREASGKKDKSKDKDKDKKDSDDTIEVVESDYTKCAVMVYVVGSNLESANGLATKDIEEMIDSDYDEDLMDIYLCTGGASKWHTSEIDEDEIAVYKLESGKLDKLDTINTSTMASPNTLQSFINIAYEDTDCDCYDLVLWNHGGGAVVGFGADENAYYQAMTMPEIGTAIGGSNLIKSGRRFEFIGFDACLMGMLEVATTLDDYANYLIASEELIPGMGWDYTCLGAITDSGDFRGENSAQIIIDAYAKFYKEETRFHGDYSLACMDLSKTGKVVESFNLLSADGIDELTSGDYSVVARARANTKAFGRMGGQAIYDTIDLYNLAENLEKEYPDSADAVKNSIDEMVVYYKSNIQRSHGVAVYFPNDNKEFAEQWLEDYSEIECCDSYKIFLDGYVTVLNGESIAEWDIDDQIAQQNPNVKGQYTLKLTDDQAATYSHSSVYIWKKNEEEHDMYFCCMIEGDVELLDDNTLQAQFDDKEFYLSNGAGQETTFTMREVSRYNDVITYEGNLFIYSPDYMNLDTATLTVRVDDQHPNGEIISIYENVDVDETNMFPQAKPYVFEDGCHISGFLFHRQVKFNADGSVAPFDEWTTPYMYLSDDIEYDGILDTEFKMNDELEEGSYFCLFNVVDTQGNLYSSGPFIAEERLTDGVYLNDNPDTSLTPDNPYDLTSGTVVLFDVYGEPIITVKVPDNYDIDTDSTSRRMELKEKNDKGKYTYHMTIIANISKDYIAYIENGTVPTNSFHPYFTFEYNKYTVKGHEIWIATYDDSSMTDTTGKMVVIPYIDCYGDKHYLEVKHDNFNKMDDNEIVSLMEELL